MTPSTIFLCFPSLPALNPVLIRVFYVLFGVLPLIFFGGGVVCIFIGLHILATSLFSPANYASIFSYLVGLALSL